MNNAGGSSGFALVEDLSDESWQESMINRLNTVEEVAAMAVLPASAAGAGITGALLNVDGGTAPW